MLLTPVLKAAKKPTSNPAFLNNFPKICPKWGLFYERSGPHPLYWKGWSGMKKIGRNGETGHEEKVMKKLITVFLLAFGLIGATNGFKESRQSNKFVNLDVGFAITKQADWHFLSLDNAEIWMASPDKSEEGQQQLQQYIQNLRDQENRTGMAPLFIAKHQEPYPHLNPMIKVSLHYIDDLPKNVSPLAIAAVMAKSYSESNEGFKLMDRIRLVRVSNFNAGYMRFTLNGELNSGETAEAMNQVYLIPRGKYVFEITISTPLQCDQLTDTALEEMMESIFILKPFEI